MSMVPRKNVITALGNAIVTSIGSDIGNRVTYTQEAPQDTTTPLCIFFETGDVPQYDMNKESLDINYQISIFGTKKAGATALVELTDTLINDLSRNAMDITGYVNEDVQITQAGRTVVEGDYNHRIIEIRIQGF